MAMAHDHPAIVYCERDLEVFRKQLANYKSGHKSGNSTDGIVPSPITHERDYVAWFVKTSPECELLRSWISGDMDKFANTIANLCEKRRAQINTADKLFEELLEISTIYSERMLPVLNEHGGLGKLLAMPPQLINATIQLLAQIIVFKELLVRKYDHKKAGELFAVIDAVETTRG
jgi:hypothetical protein